MEYLNCYICNSKTELRNGVRIKTKTKYSATGVHEIIQSFLKQSHVLRFSPNDIICERCYQRINQYDLACRMADEIQQEITNTLYITEQEYLSEEPVEFLDDVRIENATHQKDFEELQLQYDIGNKLLFCNGTTIMDKVDNEFTIEPSDLTIQTNPTIKSKSRASAECKECNIPFDTKKGLKRHQLRYHTPKKCGVCQQLFPNQMELRTHTRRDHEIEQSSNDEEEICKTVKKETEKENNFRCDICGFVENSNESLTKHIAAHENQFKCVVCGTILKHKGNLILHMRIHTDKKFFKCDKCGKTFVHKSSLRMHLQTTHTNVRNKECPKCPLKFKTTSQLNQHLVTHTGIKKHECPECGKAFGQKYNMTAHYKSHFVKSVKKQTKPKSDADVCKMEC